MENKILVIGELNVDLIVSGLPGLPSLGQEILADGLHIVMGSSSAICAAGLVRLGAAVDFLGKVGTDYYGDLAAEQLRALGVGTDHLIRDSVVPTGVTISLTYPHDRAMVTYLGCIAALRLDDIDMTLLSHYRHLHVGSYFLQRGLQPGLSELFRQAHRAGLTVSLDTGYDPDERWGGDDLRTLLELVDIFLPNEEEALAIAGVDDIEAALRELAEQARLVVVKRGARGAMSLQEGQVVHCPAFEIDAVDTTGAGDTFNAGFIYGYVMRGSPLEEALRFANACGALSTTGYGGTAAQPMWEQVLSLLKRSPDDKPERHRS